MKRGLFLVMEGVDGAGKSTQIDSLEQFLQDRGRRVKRLREPGGTAIGEEVRSILLDRKHRGMTTETELFLYCAARAQIVREVIAPTLSAGIDVLCDRFTLSTLVYQSYLGGLPLQQTRAMCDFAMDDVRPDLCLVLDLPVAESLRRRRLRGGRFDRMEAKQRNALAKMRGGYLSLAKKAGYPCVVIDALGAPAEVLKRLETALQKKIPALRGKPGRRRSRQRAVQ